MRRPARNPALHAELRETDPLYKEVFVHFREWKLDVDILDRSIAVCKELKRQKDEREEALARRRAAPLDEFLVPNPRRTPSSGEQNARGGKKTTPHVPEALQTY